MRTRTWCGWLAGMVALLAAAPGAGAAPQHAIAMHGEPALASGFGHFDYANPEAPDGGRLTIGVNGTFDSLNPLIVRGVAASGIREYVFESLMARGLDEPFSLYGLIAETIETPDDRSWVEFTLRPEARFSDGEKITVEDVIFSWEVLKEKGRPNHRTYYSQVTRVEKTGERSVRFVFDDDIGREMPLIMGLMPILPRHHFDLASFEQTGLSVPVGSGPYVVADMSPGASITYRRDPDWWAAELDVTRGLYNFEEIRYDYYRDGNTMFEAFKRGLTDVRLEKDPARWTTAYGFPAVDDGRVLLEEFETGLPSGMSGLVFNTRREIFADVRVRRALIHLFDAEWMNRNLFHGRYERTESYYHGSELSFLDRPATELERRILEPWLDEIDPAILDGSYRHPDSDGSGRDRDNLREALALLKEAGYRPVDGIMRHQETGRPLAFEMLTVTRDQERLALAWARSLERAGIALTVRQVDTAQYEQRRQTYDFDMIQNFWHASLSPGNEQKFYFGSEAAATDGTRNYMGAESPAVDAAIEAMLAAEDRESFVAATRALDRALVDGAYVVPLFHLPRQWVARWERIGRPETTSLYGYVINAWWAKDAR